mgnify:FL=1
MTDNKPKKPSQEWFDHIRNNYTYDREKGQVVNNKTGKPCLRTDSHGYMRLTVYVHPKKRSIATHHMVWFFEYGEWATSQLDHIDGNKLNNHCTNLRLVTNRENTQSYHRLRKSSSKYLGVSRNKAKKKWVAYIWIGKKLSFLGYFTCELEAARAYDRALVSINLDPLNVKIMRNEERLQKVMEFINDNGS